MQGQKLSRGSLLEELTRTLHPSYFRQRLGLDEIKTWLAITTRRALWVEAQALVRGVATHPEDDAILAPALSARADYLVTGDRKLQRLGQFEGVHIVSPAQFLTILSAMGEEEAA